MLTNDVMRVPFILFAFLIQVLLIINFAARNWKPTLEMKYGWLIYAWGIPSFI